MTSVDPPEAKAWVTIATVVTEKTRLTEDKPVVDEEQKRKSAEEEKSNSGEQTPKSVEKKPFDCEERKDPTLENSGLEHTVYSNEQLMTVDIELSLEEGPSLNQTHLVLVVDNSGSMSGQPWIQVQESLHAIINASIDMKHLRTDLIVYNSAAKHIKFTKLTYKKTIDGLKAGGMTNFISAFKKVTDLVSEAGPDYTNTVVVLLTDGQDTCNKKDALTQLVPNLNKGFKKYHKQATVHAVGFSKEHDFRFLKELAEKGGASPGMFRYCEPGDDKQALQAKLDELFDYILGSDVRKVSVEMMDDKNFVYGPEKRCKSVTLGAKVIDGNGKSGQDKGTHLVADTWMYIANPKQLPTMSLLVETRMKINGITKHVSIPCEIVNMTHTLVDKASEKSRWRLRILERNVDSLLDETADAVAKGKDVSKLQERVEKFQENLSKTKVFGNGINKADREQMFELIRDVQTNLDQIQKMLAEYMRSGTNSISLLARAHDMRYQAVFNKGRRQRVMDKRATKNMQHAANAQKQLTELVIDEEEVKNISQDANDFYFCVMSQNSVKDVLLGDEVEDAIGFGLAVRRSEVVLDEPTLIRLQVISGTLVSRNAMLDALEYKINVSSQLKAHGGFEFYESSLGVTTVGSSREPINAWLPLYVTASHWKRVKVILKPALGSFCTLDPLGYHFKQLDVMFMVLGSIIGELSEQTTGEHQLKLLFAVLRTCSACLIDFEKVTDATSIVKDFVASPAGRTKDIVPNLVTLIGYIVALPTDAQKDIFPDKESLNKFWLAFVSEWLRRAASPVYKESSLVEINGIVNSLVNVVTTTDVGEATEHVKLGCNYTRELESLCLQQGNVDVDIPVFDPSSGLEDLESKIELEHSEIIDKAMEIWAQQKTGHQKNLDQSKKYKSALRVVNNWLNDKNVISTISEQLDDNASGSDVVQENADATGSDDDDVEAHEELQSDVCRNDDTAISEERYDADNLSDHTIRVIAKIQKNLTKSAYPNISSIPSLMAFVNTWLKDVHDMNDIDSNSGLAPDSWIEEIKSAIKDTYMKLKTYAKQEAGESGDMVYDTANQTQTDVTNDEEVTEDVSQSNIDNTEDYDYYDDDDYDDDDDDYDDDEDGYTTMSARRERKKQRNKIEKKMCLTQIVKLIDSQINSVQIIRAMLCQAVRFHSNSSARAAVTDKKMLDVSDGTEVAMAIIKLNHEYLDEFKNNARQNAVERALWKRANYCMMWASSPWAFIGYLMNTHKSRLEGFSNLVDMFIKTVSPDTVIPYLQDKVHMLLTGKYETYPVLDNGNQWLPEKKMASNFKKLLGEEVWSQFELDLRSNVQIHVYRESDIPNRHGHCNSNPYIPNALRQKLGMPLLVEKKNAYKAARRRSRR